MSRVITLTTECAYEATQGKDTPEGIVVTEVHDTYEDPDTGETRPFTYKTYRFPELGQKRILKDGSPIVLTLAGRTWRIIFERPTNMGGDGIPSPGARVTFIETQDDETPHTLWDQAAKDRKYLDGLITNLEAERKEFAESSKEDSWWADNIELDAVRVESVRKSMERGEGVTRPIGYCCAFGQPDFIQNIYTPGYDGKAAFPLLTLNTNWGDVVNENYFIALNGDGIPVAVFMEVSCC